jgi:hypothetical protein
VDFAVPTGKRADQPANDSFQHGAQQFPAAIEETIRRLAHIEPMLLKAIDIDVFDCDAGRGLKQAGVKLRDRTVQST